SSRKDRDEMLRRWILGLSLLTLLLPAPAWAQQEAADEVANADAPGTPYVVLVGIDKYPDSQIIPRTHAEDDGKAFYDLFTSKEHLGATAKNVKLLLGSPDKNRPHELATKENIIKALQWVSKTATRDDLVVFAFFGQGAPLGERACYFALDSTFK